MVLSHSASGGMININPDEADAVRAELLKAVELDPGYADAYNLLSVTESVKGDPKEAIKYAEKAVQLNPRNEYYQMNLANFHLRAGEIDKATALLTALKGSSNSMVAQNAEQNLEQLQRMKEFKAQGGTIMVRQGNMSSDFSAEDNERVEVVETPKVDNSHPVAFLKGTLLSIDCEFEPAAMLEVKSGTKIWHFRAEDRSKLVLIGADAFSCTWKNKPVAVNYREIGTGAGELISLELQ
jgi:tetratricopeptide (TPR) repeat protein